MSQLSSETAAVASQLGAQLRARRRELGITQQDLADLAGVAVRSIHELERGKPTIRLSVLVAAAEALGMTPTLALGLNSVTQRSATQGSAAS